MIPSTDRDHFLAELHRRLGAPYVWGGDDDVLGFDCSGLIVECGQAIGLLPRGDWTAAMLAERYKERAVTAPTPGCLLFWRRGPRIGHVEAVYRINDHGEPLTIGASGGGSRERGLELRQVEVALRDAPTPGAWGPADLIGQTQLRAIQRNAVVKCRPATPGWELAVDPFPGGRSAR